MYLSRLILNPASRQVQSEIARPYEMHRTIMRAFPDGLNEQTERVLFRLEPDERHAGLGLLVQSWGPPDWSYLAGAPGCLLETDDPNPAVKHFTPRLRQGQRLAYRLRANPTVKTKREGRPVRQGILQEDQQIEWLARKGQAGGFRLLSARTSREDMIDSGAIPRDGAGKDRARFVAVQFDGVLEVTDADRLNETLRNGVGSAKGFGFGLLSVAPHR